MIAQGNFLTYFAPNHLIPTGVPSPLPPYFPPLVSGVPSGTPSSYRIPALIVILSSARFASARLPSHYLSSPAFPITHTLLTAAACLHAPLSAR